MVLWFSNVKILLISSQLIFMKEILVKELEPRIQKYVSKANGLIKVEPFYASSILSNIVKVNPNCIEARQMLRKAQVRMASATKSGLLGFFSKIKFGRVNQSAIKKNPKESLEAAEQQIDANFSNTTAHKTIALAAKELGLVDTALLGYEYLYKIDQTN